MTLPDWKAVSLVRSMMLVALMMRLTLPSSWRSSDLNYAIFDNVRVVSLDFVIKNFVRSGNTIDFDFYSPLGGKLSDFHLQTSSDPAPGNWTDDNTATIFEIPGGFHVNATAAASVRFFKMRR